MTSEDGEGLKPSLSAQALADAVPGLDKTADVAADSFRQLPGAHLRLDDIVALREHLRGLDADGFVVTQGTDTLEETAFALDLLHDGDRPIVVTGAMRDPSMPGSDGGANLVNAVRIAASEPARGQGVLVTMDDRVHAARFVRKGHASAPSAFESTTVGPLGWIAEDRVRLPLRVAHRVHVALPGSPSMPRVALVRIGLGDDGSLFDAVAQCCDAAVIDAMGVGHLPGWLAAPAGELAGMMPAMLASRTGAGEGFASTYGFEGSERDLIDRGLTSAGILDGLKARILLTLALAAGWSRAEISAAVDTLSA